MQVSDVISIIALIVSLLTALIAIYFQYLRKIRRLAMTCVDAYIENSILYASAIYDNIGNQSTTISSSKIILTTEECYGLAEDTNREKQKFVPFVLKGGEQKYIQISYRLPSFERLDINKIKIQIYTQFIDTEGKLRYEHCEIGYMLKNEFAIAPVIVPKVYQLSRKKEILWSIRLPDK